MAVHIGTPESPLKWSLWVSGTVKWRLCCSASQMWSGDCVSFSYSEVILIVQLVLLYYLFVINKPQLVCLEIQLV